MKKFLISTIILIFGYSFSFGNGLTLSNISVNQGAGLISCNVQWNNSWRVSGEPKNYDAVWVFVKFRDCAEQTGVQFSHGLISTTITDHTLGTLEAVKADGTAGVDVAPNNTGIMLRRNAVGIYPAAVATNIILKVTNLPAVGNLDIRVFGIEMVYIPSGDYYLGDGTVGDNDAQFKTSNVNSSPILITGEGAVQVYTGTVVTNSSYFFNNTNIPAEFPKGHNAFHIMKYEITQQQYADFLNTTSSAFWNIRYDAANSGLYRNRLTSGGTYPNFFYSSRPYRAQNYLSWADISAFLDWAALNPMSELQYEKACRGPQAYFTGEYAWGNTFITKADQINQENEDGTEITGVGNCVYNQSVVITGGDASQGPMRAGIFATAATTTREATGATYYGVMEMTGNVLEWCVMAIPATSVAPAPNPTAFTRQLWGDGILDNTGNADVTGWPSPTSVTDCRTMVRGGHWYSVTYPLFVPISSRNFALLTSTNWNYDVITGANNVYIATTNPPHTNVNTYKPNGRNPHIGGRGVR
ncbi:MAG: hypothetical protein A2X12_02980 [Bacteroidetes bacterium GWE2_29_8]|nr:MAG: hypothetical protein A2X12_02980 [Bacteroidetes bacterium GWE2_29_8]OFY15377.1 MAG: hypothetical protein A2X02_02995 [Bacteroidetes bacterium GWF2_29_10]